MLWLHIFLSRRKIKKLITKALKRLCYNNVINETNILIISRIAQFCNNYYTSDIVSSIVDNC